MQANQAAEETTNEDEQDEQDRQDEQDEQEEYDDDDLNNISGEKVSLTPDTIENVWNGVTSRIEFILDNNGEYLICEEDDGVNKLFLNPNSRITPEAVRMWKKARLFSVKGNQNTKTFKIRSITPARVLKSNDGWILNQSGEVTFS